MRALAAAALVLAATTACAEAPRTAPPPEPRPAATQAPGAASGNAGAQAATQGPQAASYGLTGAVGYAVIDARTGERLAALEAATPFAPASVAKAPTALYALERLGLDHRFATTARALGPIEGRRILGDLALVGGGDPELDSADLAALARDAAQAVARVEGGLVVRAGPVAPLIDADQPERAAYNPAVAALNLNFNRVRLRWTRDGAVALLAQSDRHSPETRAVRLETAPKECGCPALAYAADARGEGWRVREGALSGDGALWLPVRAPAAYAADVFRTAAEGAGMVFGAAAAEGAGGAAAEGATVARRLSRPLEEIVVDMLDHSTNLTAEVLGIAATREGGETGSGMAASAAAMNRWAAGRLEAPLDAEIAFDNHSGLSARSRVSPRRMAELLAAAYRADPAGFAALLPRHAFDEEAPEGAVAHAKTGTMDFVRGLAGYVFTPSGRVLAFAYFANDMARRDATPEIDGSRIGARTWRNRAVTLESALLADWTRRFD
ncbi:D-alanyl-D-alanine carboxypeptidase / D-alanyl-D-alanine-endopeptidase (penicillin-binding protein 4) [Rubrimonas cliftonensis]|uniref:D-alanyl-D-alanine carboxypeptidase / D-alanyl-D-alanine-endopeptidase (Penicillin-binding protein 4) n=2 Tax=Rubrimonas cliftonensis TaxID=89524 RepID=A0A1H3VE84_9RHOB|nr:D-alanyl-D-alanine carboxypeptidase / D-alanyl-D-alanine-endopeptidase (penicillin-binding protein 4) [Rubrimonas cliftonensis]